MFFHHELCIFVYMTHVIRQLPSTSSCVEQNVDMTAGNLLWRIETSALSGLCVLAHVISLVGWPKHVKFFSL